ncbi:hypothetical protein CRYUN_Cryun17cG0042300 [Craigia yunnanensis]
MPGKVEELIEEINGSESKIYCVLVDQKHGWALEIAEKHGIKRAAFCPAAAALLVLGFSIQKMIDDGIIDQDGRPFLWVVRSDTTDGRNDAYPVGYQQRVAAWEKMVGWASQQKVLAYPSIACFESLWMELNHGRDGREIITKGNMEEGRATFRQ